MSRWITSRKWRGNICRTRLLDYATWTLLKKVRHIRLTGWFLANDLVVEPELQYLNLRRGYFIDKINYNISIKNHLKFNIETNNLNFSNEQIWSTRLWILYKLKWLLTWLKTLKTFHENYLDSRLTASGGLNHTESHINTVKTKDFIHRCGSP